MQYMMIVTWFARALISASTFSGDWLGNSKGAEQEAHVEGKANNRSSIYDSNGGSNYNATFTVVPESSTIALIAGSLCFAYVMLRRRLS